MSESLVLPFINRYYYQCVSQSLSGIFAYGSRCDIFVIKALSNPVEILDSKCIQLAHSSRVSCVSFCKDKDAELLASTGDNGDIKVWDLKNSNTCVNGGLVSGKTVEWVHGSSNILFYPLDSRHVAKWFLSSNLVRKIKTESDIPVTIMASNKNNLLALGHHNGTVTIIDIIQEKVLQKFKSHSQDICSLSWNPASQEMLLTTSMDLSIRSWKIGENKPVNSYHAPVGRVRFDDKKKVYIAGIWHPSYQDMVICSNFRGDVGEVCLSKDEIPKFSSYLSLDVNAKGTLNFLTYTKKTEQGMQDLLIIFDFYKLSVWNISEKKLELKTPLVLGFIYGLSISSLNPNLLAISGSDGLLRIFNDQIDSVERNTSVYLHYKTKIMTVSWHPIYENIIAYGTDEGRVGIIDIFKKKSLYTFETYHTDKTYTVCWGPFKHLEGSKENEYFVYSCGSNSIFINRLNHSKEQALDFDDFAKVPDLMDSTKKSYTELNWNSNFSHVLTASCKGFIDLFNDHFIFLTRFSVEMRSIEYLTWHPERTYASPEGSSLKFWFAASGSDTVLHLFNAAKTLVEPFQEEQDSKWESKKLVGHKKRIGALCWSQHNDGHLASASRDGSVLVWNVCTGTILASYLHHKDSVLTVQWSVNDHDMIYSGSEDGTVRMWKISEHANIKPPEKVPPRRKGNRAPKKVCKGFRNYSEKKEVNSLVDENCESLKNKSLIDEKENDFTDLNDDEALLSSKIGDTAAESSPVSDKGYLGEREVKRLRTLYPCRSTIPLFPFHSLISSATNEVELEDCLQLADVLREKTFTPSGETQISDSLKNSKCTLTNEDILKLGPFTDQMTALKMMEIQAEKFRIEGNCRNSCLLSVMIGNVKDFIERDAINKNLSSFHVSLAPSVSHSFWLETCEKFANQLLEDHQYRQACTYFLMCNKVYEAVSVIAEKVDVMEALTLARARLPDSDPMIKRLLFQARKRYIAHNNQARVAKCLLALNQPLTAAKTLFFVSNPKFMDAAIYIARLYKLDNDIKKYVYLYMMKCLSLDDWNALAVLVNEEPSMKVYSSLIAVHKAFKTHLQYHRMKNKGLVKKSFSQRDSCKPVKFWIGSICMETKDSFINYVYHILLSNNLLPAKTEEMFDILKALEKMFIRKEAYDCVVQADIMISLCITQYIFYCILEDYTAANFYFLKIFEFSYHESFFLKAVCCLFIPTNLSWNYDTHSIICESETDNSEENDTGTVLSHFHNINRAIAEEIMSFKSDYITSKFYSKDSYLLPTLGENLDVLKRKRINEYVLAYFVANITNDLMKLVDEREIMCFAEKLRSPELQKEDIESSFLSEKSENNIFIQTSTTCDVDIEEKSTQEEITTEEEELRNLIKDVLKDADEKVKFLLNTSKSAVDNDILQENIIPEETSLCIVPQKESFADFNEEKLKPPSEERHEKELAIASNDESFADFNEEKLKLLNEENLLAVASNDENFADFNEEKLKPQNEERHEKELLAITSNDESSHAQCLVNIDFFLNVVLFIISGISRQEFVCGHYLIRSVENAYIKKESELPNEAKVKTESFDESNQNMNTITASSKIEKSCTPESFEKGEFASKMLEIAEKEMNDDEILAELSNCIPHVEISNNIGNVNRIQSAKIKNAEINNLDDILIEPSAKCISNAGLFERNSEHYISCTSVSEVDKFQADVPNGNKMECYGSISNTDDIGSNLVAVDSNYNHDSFEKELDSLHKTCANSFQIVNPFGENIRKELDVIEKKIHVLMNESHASLMSYPVPYEVLQNVLQAMYSVWRKSECSISKEVLHKYIEQIIHWSYSFSDGKMKFSCEICSSK